jgi:hypothetical protein
MLTEHEATTVLSRHGLERNARPCGSCAYFSPIASGVALCTKKRVQVARDLLFLRKLNEDCWASQRGQ